MAKGRNRALRTAENRPIGHPMPKGFDKNNEIELSQEAIDRHWGVLPPGAKSFILGASTHDGMFPLYKLIQFWSSPPNIESTRGNLAGTICGAAWYLALVYMKLGQFNVSRALTVNGSFIHQCYNTSIEYVRGLCIDGQAIPEYKLPYFVRGVQSIRSPQHMESFIKSYLPEEYTHMMTSFANMSSRRHVMGYIHQISDDWNDTSSAGKNHRPTTNNDGVQLELILVDDKDEDNRYSLRIGSSTTLKVLFNKYADKRGVSLRSLRFSYMGKTLFLSSAGQKTPEELGMKDHDKITVHDTTQSFVDNSPKQKAQTSNKTKLKKKAKNKEAKRKAKKPQQQSPAIKTIEEYKVEHSKQLTKIHDEVDAQFKQIRQRLNNLAIERSQPKIKSKRPRAPKKEITSSFVLTKPNEGKAGKSRYEIQVGEVKNLYKTTKPSAIASQCNASSPLSTLDLHGCTREEALVRLDESLKVWMDTAMQGSYPFVQQATIVCGCGSQTLSETVQEWIRSNDKVSNAPKMRPLRRRAYASRAA